MTDYLLNPNQPATRRSIWYIWLGAMIAAGLAVWGGVLLIKNHQPTPPPEPPPAPAVESAAAIPTDPTASLLDEARQLRKDGKVEEAREKAFAALAQATDAGVRNDVETLLGEINIELVFSPRPMAEKTDYTVEAGDSLDKIAKKFGTTVDLLRKGNNVQGTIIRPGNRFRVFSGKFSIVVDKSDNDLVLLLNDRFFKRYRVGTGEYSKTPVGTFKITDRIPQPPWWRPDGKLIPYGDPENLLGTHWLALDIPGYGIHGTWQNDTVGRQSSAGCIRLLNDDIEQIFTLVTVGTPVQIQD